MELRTTCIGDVPLLEAGGDIDHSTCATLQSALDEVFERGQCAVLIDLHNVAYIDSGGLSVLLGGVRTVRDRGWLGVIGPNANVQRLLEIVGLLVDPCFRVFEATEAAEAAVAEGTTT
ncbi:MAG TPA: STAS domain-containing protein [Thermoleophilia bacterium]|nr:STAS domain-containing protein [Thermoleophilia bacterium]